MNELLASPMLLSGGLFAGGVVTIAWERVPAWRQSDPQDFRTTFGHSIRRMDRVQPALLTICLLSTIGFTLGAEGAARAVAVLAATGFLMVLVGSAAWLLPLQRRLAAPGADPSWPEVERLRSRWLLGHLIRTVVTVAALIFAVVAALL